MEDSSMQSGRQLVERFTPERCYITEWWNNVADESVSVARVRVKPGVRTALHRLRGIRERYLILAGTAGWKSADAPATSIPARWW